MKDLLFILADYPFRGANRQALSELLKEVEDWERLVYLVNAHGIIALARYNIGESGLDNLIPAETLSRLENGYIQSVARNSWLTERWKSVNEILCKAGIKHILLKGMALEHTIYGSKGLRQMSDNDILVKPKEAREAWELLNKEGFEIAPQKSELHKRILFELGHHLPALYKDGYSLEIHSHLFEDKGFVEYDYDSFFVNVSEITINNIKAYILPKEVHLHYLIEHFIRHVISGECQIRMYSDIILLDPESSFIFPESFVYEPSQVNKKSFRKTDFRKTVYSLPVKYRLRFIIGDILPSVSWMKRRYRCGAIRAFLHYPQRLGKLLWLI